jgi:hypothetical protein
VVHGSTQRLFPGVRRIQENTAINTKNKSHAVTAEIEVPQAGATGVIVAQGGSMAGWSLYAHEGRLKYHYNYMAVRQYAVADSSSLPAGRHQVRMEFTYDGGGLGKGATVTLFVDGKQVGQGASTGRFFVPNEIGRFSLGTKNKGLQTTADGSLTIYVQADAPPEAQRANWLPEGQDFSLFIRAYWPQAAVIDGSWAPPPVQKQ